jgi:hypothetical protein
LIRQAAIRRKRQQLKRGASWSILVVERSGNMTDLRVLLDPLLGKEEPDVPAILKLEQELLESGDELIVETDD